MKKYTATSALTLLSRGSSVLALAMFTTAMLQPADAAVYKWVDENGRVHYTDQPQAGKHDKYRPGSSNRKVSPGQSKTEATAGQAPANTSEGRVPENALDDQDSVRG